MRVDMVSEHASPLASLGGVDAGGQNVHVADLAKAMARLGANVVVHTRRDAESLPSQVWLAPGVLVRHVDAGPPTAVPKDELWPHMPAFTRSLRRSWCDDPPDAVHSHFWMSGVAALDAARPMAIPVMHTYHALGVVKRRHQGDADTSPPERLRMETRLAREVDRVVATTNDEARELMALGAEPGRITVVPCGVDTERFTPVGQADVVFSGRRRVVVVSRLVERKGIGNVIEALAAVPDVELVIAGGPPAAELRSDPAARRYVELARAVGVLDRVELRLGVSRDRLPGLIRSADLGACCPWYEPFGLVAVEAMACGVPVVASRVGGLAESVVHDVTGLLVPPRSPGSIAAAIDELLGDDARRREMGVAAAERAQRFAWSRVAAETLAVAAALRVPNRLAHRRIA